MRRRRADVPDSGAGLAIALGMLRSGAAPQAAWVAAGWDRVGPDGAPLGAPAGVRASARLARSTGSPLAPLVAVVVEQWEAREDSIARSESGMAGAQLSARMLGWLPLVGVLFSLAIDPGSLGVFLEPWGVVLAGGAGALTAAGRRWLARMTQRATAPADDERAAVGVALALLEACVAAGADLAGALVSVGAAMSPEAPVTATALGGVGRGLRAGMRWEDAWGAAESSARTADIEQALRWAWRAGAAPGPALAAARKTQVRAEMARREAAVSELSVRAALPLSLCLLPAFVLVGVVPMLIAVARSGGLVP